MIEYSRSNRELKKCMVIKRNGKWLCIKCEKTYSKKKVLPKYQNGSNNESQELTEEEPQEMEQGDNFHEVNGDVTEVDDQAIETGPAGFGFFSS